MMSRKLPAPVEVSVYDLIYKSMDSLNRPDPERKKRAEQLLLESFKPVEKLPIKADPTLILEGLKRFRDCYQAAYGAVGFDSPFREGMDALFVGYINSINQFINSGSTPPIGPDAIKAAVTDSIKMVSRVVYNHCRSEGQARGP